VSDLAGGGRHFETGNLVAGNIRVHQAMLELLRPFLNDALNA